MERHAFALTWVYVNAQVRSMIRWFPITSPLAACGLSVLAACSATDDDKKAGAEPGADAGQMTSQEPVSEPGLSSISSDGRMLRDELGRALLLRGINARVDGVFDVDLGKGRVPLEEAPELTDADCQQMAEWGINLVRLPIQWSGVEPERDRFDEAYLSRVDAAVDCIHAAGVSVLVDLHQDAYSKEIGEDGAPLWAIEPPPEELLEGPLTGEELQRRRFSAPVTAAFASFFDENDRFGLQAEYIAMLEHVAKRYREYPGVIGIDLFNEPVVDTTLLRSFHQAAAEAVRKVAPDLLIFFEPTGPRGYVGSEAPVNPPFGVSGAVYAPHLYPAVFLSSEEQLLEVDIEELRSTFDAGADEAAEWKTPWLVGEFGGPPATAFEDKYLGLMYRLLDERFISATLWLWKEDSQGSWGLFDTKKNGDWTPRPAMVNIVSRPYIERAAGTPTRMTVESGALELRFNEGFAAAHRVYVPTRLTIAKVECDGEKREAKQAADKRHFDILCGATAGNHTLRITFR